MTTLEDAWAWYRAVADGSRRLAHLSKHWAALPWGGADRWVASLEADNVLRHVEADHLLVGAETIDAWLDDLAVLVLFSVFEAIVRDLVEAQVRPEAEQLRHPALRAAGRDVLQAVAEGSFFRVLEPFNGLDTSPLIEQVNQVRKYRNWVAHGRRQDREPTETIIPKAAYDRLSALLDLLRPAPPDLSDPNSTSVTR